MPDPGRAAVHLLVVGAGWEERFEDVPQRIRKQRDGHNWPRYRAADTPTSYASKHGGFDTRSKPQREPHVFHRVVRSRDVRSVLDREERGVPDHVSRKARSARGTEERAREGSR